MRCLRDLTFDFFFPMGSNLIQKKISAIRDMSPPKNKSELETILGMVNYLSRFAPNLSEINTPLRLLLKQNIEFVWDETQTKAFEDERANPTRAWPSPVLLRP